MFIGDKICDRQYNCLWTICGLFIGESKSIERVYAKRIKPDGIEQEIELLMNEFDVQKGKPKRGTSCAKKTGRKNDE